MKYAYQLNKVKPMCPPNRLISNKLRRERHVPNCFLYIIGVLVMLFLVAEVARQLTDLRQLITSENKRKKPETESSVPSSYDQ